MLRALSLCLLVHLFSAFGLWSGRVRFQGNEPTGLDSSLIIKSTQLTDEGRYTCRIVTFPNGNFERKLSLTVWTIPISTLEPSILVEGQSFRRAAACRSVGRPRPSLSWDTDLTTGELTNSTSDTGSFSSFYSLHPLRSMNGKRLDCLVWHPSYTQPLRHRNTLVVHYPPDAKVSGYDNNWFLGMEAGMLHCVSGGNPKPQNFTWTRQGGVLPQGVIPHPNGTLVFGHPLSGLDAGLYQCEAKNAVGISKESVDVKVTDEEPRKTGLDNFLLIARRNKNLERQLTVKDNEISNLVRQASIRRVNSDQMDSIEQDQALTLDHLGRPVLQNGSRRGMGKMLDRDEEKRLRVESYARSSTISLQDKRMHPPLVPSPFPVLHSTEILRNRNGSGIGLSPDGGGGRVANSNRNQQHSPLSYGYPSPTDEEDEEDEGLGGLMCPENQGRRAHSDQDPGEEGDPDGDDEEDDPYGSETNSSLLLEPQRVHFHAQPHHLANGSLRSKTRSPLPNPHASLIHKAQIV
ncbi:hypothetical protein NHX12_014130 [Muraenolepis orangiensis]|uniref:Ig-like domain-containing protein n=1 Tax=Muraenolepis orangiensis TaxID=630683 RepID=A0A9Q0DBR1_9TELE|nr:hypothetical protein NHX12_014130 [Muraenolepis orangiensis]